MDLYIAICWFQIMRFETLASFVLFFIYHEFSRFRVGQTLLLDWKMLENFKLEVDVMFFWLRIERNRESSSVD